MLRYKITIQSIIIQASVSLLREALGDMMNGSVRSNAANSSKLSVAAILLVVALLATIASFPGGALAVENADGGSKLAAASSSPVNSRTATTQSIDDDLDAIEPLSFGQEMGFSLSGDDPFAQWFGLIPQQNGDHALLSNNQTIDPFGRLNALSDDSDNPTDSKAALEAAQAAYNAAAAEVAELEAAKQSAESARDDAAAAQSDAEGILTGKQSELDDAEEALSAAGADLIEANGNKTDAETNLSVANSAAEAAQARVGEATAAKQSADSAVEAAQAVVADAEANLEAAQVQINKGSFGFFESVNATAAIKALNRDGFTNEIDGSNGDLFTNYVHAGDAKDAISLDNMKEAIEWIEYANTIRAEAGLAPFLVTDELMASAQANADYSAYHYQHASYVGEDFRKNAENLYRARIGYERAYQGWYYEEKAIFDAKVADNPSLEQYRYDSFSVYTQDPNLYLSTGHYLNFVWSLSTYTGLGLCYNSSTASIQHFGASAFGEPSFTVADYKTRFMNYYNRVKAEPEQALANAQAELDEALAAQREAENALADANDNAAAAQEAVNLAEDALEAAELAVGEAQAAVNAAQGNVAAKQQECSQAQAAVDAAIAVVAEKQTALDNAVENLVSGNERLENARAALADAQEYYNTDIKYATVTPPDACVYTGFGQTPAIPLVECGVNVLQEQTHYLASYSDNTEVGEATVTIEGVSPYHGTQDVHFTIGKASIGDAIFANIPVQVYTGRAHEPAISATFGGGDLTAGTHFEVTYSSNINVGTAQVKVKGIGSSFTGEKDLTFEIKKATPYITNVEAAGITYGDTLANSNLSGSAQNSPEDETAVSGEFSWANSSIAPIVADSEQTPYEVLFTPSDTNNYETTTTTTVVKVAKAERPATWPQSSYTVDYAVEELSNDILATAASWQFSDSDLGAALEPGEERAQTFTAHYVGDDAANYEVTTAQVTVIRSACAHETTEVRDAKEATCAEQGYTGDTYCTICGKKTMEGEAIATLEHTWKWNVVKPATCKDEGEERQVCTVCGAEGESRALQKTNEHQFGNWKLVTNASCTEVGTAERVCAVCEIKETREIPALGHDWGTWTVIKEASATEIGLKDRTCARCGETEQASIPKLDLAPVQQDTLPSAISGEISPDNPVAAAAVEKQIMGLKSDSDPAGSTFSLLQAKGVAKSKTATKLSWKKVAGATGYVIYGNKCGKANKYQKIATVKGTSYTQKKLKKGTYYKYLVVAVKGNAALATSKTIHVATKGGKVGNAKSVKTKAKASSSLKKGKKQKLGAKAVPQSKKLKVKKHRAIAYDTSDPTIATVNKKGVVTAKKAGKCTVYAYAQNGVFKAVKITVK